MGIDDGVGYSYEDLRPIHPIVHVTLLMQAAGALVGFLGRGEAGTFIALWRGAAIASFVGFVVGFFYQLATSPEGIRDNKGMVAFCGLVSLLMGLAGFVLVPS